MKITGIAKGILWLFAAYVYAGLVGGRLPYFILYASIGVMLVSIMWARLLAKVEVHAALHSNRSDVGKTVIMKLQVENNSYIPLPWIHCCLRLPEVFGPDVREVVFGLSLKSRGKVELEVPLECHVRGFFQWGRIELRTGDIFGILNSLKTVETRMNLLVRPKAEYLGKTFFRGVGNRSGDTVWSMKPGRQVSEFRGVRTYTPGDSLSRIHWKASARSQHFLVKEYDQSRLNEMLLFLDLSSSTHFGVGYDNTVERGVAVAASLAATAIQDGLNVGCTICSDDTLVLPPGRSKGHLGLILDFMARGLAGPGKSFSKIVMYEGLEHPRGTLLVLVTPEVNEELSAALAFLSGKGYKAVIVLIKPEDFGQINIDIEARDKVTMRLKHLGVRVLLVDRRTDLRALFGGMRNEAC